MQASAETKFPLLGVQGCGSGGFFHTARANASRAHANMLPRTFDNRFHALQVRIPPPPPRVVRVADDVSIVRRFAAEFALQCHWVFLLRAASRSRIFDLKLDCETELFSLADQSSAAKHTFSF